MRAFPVDVRGIWEMAGSGGGTDPGALTRLIAPYFPQEHWTALDLLISELDLIPTAIRHTGHI